MCIEYREIKFRNHSVFWIQVPEVTNDFLKHCNLCICIFEGFKKILKEIDEAEIKFFGVVFFEKNNYARELAKNFEEDNELEFGSLGFRKNPELGIGIFIPPRFEAEEKQLLLIAPQSVMEKFLKQKTEATS